MKEAEIRALFDESPFADRSGEIMGHALPMLHLVRSGAADEGQAAGGSRLGGLPDLPVGVDWPVCDGRPLDFLAQINLAEAAATAQLPGMPESGVLAFFYDAENQPWGFDPKDRGGWRVLYFADDPARLQKTAPPAPVAPSDPPPRAGFLARILGRGAEPRRPADPLEPFPAHRLGFTLSTGLPDLFEQTGLDIDDGLWDEMEAIIEELEADCPDPDHRLGGHPSQIQGDMKLECQLASNGLYCGDGAAYESERGRALKPGADEWLLLLQIDSDEDGPGWMWGDVGRIYFWIRRPDLAARNFDNVWCVLQCY